METSGERTQRLIEEMENSPGYRFIRARDLHKSSGYAFTENGRVLIEALKSFRDYIAFPGLDEQAETNRQHREILRHFQNFVTSALALVEASRNWKKELQVRCPAFIAEYDARVASEFLGSVDHLLIQDLRNYMSHYRLPLSASQGTFTLKLSLQDDEQNNEMEWAVVLDLLELRQWSNWRPEPRAYLASCSDDINLLTIVEPYHKRVVSFYDWFYQRLEELHAADIAESVKRHEELNAPSAFQLAKENPPLEPE